MNIKYSINLREKLRQLAINLPNSPMYFPANSFGQLKFCAIYSTSLWVMSFLFIYRMRGPITLFSDFVFADPPVSHYVTIIKLLLSMLFTIRLRQSNNTSCFKVVVFTQMIPIGQLLAILCKVQDEFEYNIRYTIW